MIKSHATRDHIITLDNGQWIVKIQGDVAVMYASTDFELALEAALDIESEMYDDPRADLTSAQWMARDGEGRGRAQS